MMARLKSYPTLAISLSVIAMSMVAFGFVNFGGIGVSADSASYVCMADNVLAGNGVKFCDAASRSIVWPPGYPLALAALSVILLVDAYVAGMMIAVLSHGILVLVSLLWLKDMTDNKVTLVVGIVIIMFSAPFLYTSRRIMSDPLSTSLMVAGVYWLYLVYKNRNISMTTILSLTVLILVVVSIRWMGIALGTSATVVVAWIIWQNTKSANLIAYVRALIPTVVPFMFIILWGMISRESSSFIDTSITSVFNSQASIPVEFIKHILFHVVNWFAPIALITTSKAFIDDLNPWLVNVVGWLSIIMLFSLCVWALIRGLMRTHYAVPFAFTIVYSTLLIFMAVTVWSGESVGLGTLRWDSSRRIDPIYIPIVLPLLVCLLDSVVPKVRNMTISGIRYVASGMVYISITALVATSIWGTYDVIIRQDFTGYWKNNIDSNFANELRRGTKNGSIYSNKSSFTYYLMREPARPVLRAEGKWYKNLSHDDWIVRVRAHGFDRPHVFDKAFKHVDVEIVHEDKIGTIYRVVEDTD